MQADVEAAVTAGETMSGLMRRWLHSWYGAEGLLVLDPQDAGAEGLGGVVVGQRVRRRRRARPCEVRKPWTGLRTSEKNNVFWIDEVQGRKGVIRTERGMAGR